MDYPTRRVEDIKRLKEKTLEEQKDLLELARAIQYSILSCWKKPTDTASNKYTGCA